MSFVDKYPYGKAPFALLVIAIVAVGLRIATARRHDERPDLVIATFTDAHHEAYRKAIPRFEREHGVKVQVQFVHWASLQSRLQSAMLAGIFLAGTALAMIRRRCCSSSLKRSSSAV